MTTQADMMLALSRRLSRASVEERQRLLGQLRARGIAFELLPIPARAEETQRLPASYAQSRLWFLWQLDPLSHAYNMSSALTLEGPLDERALTRTFDALIQRHEALRTLFVPGDDGKPMQFIHAHQPLSLSVEELSHLRGRERQERAADLVRKTVEQPFDLVRGPLFRVRLIRLEAERHVLAVAMHHVISDGWSMNVIIEDFARLYAQISGGAPPDLPALPVQYADYALWQRSFLEAGEGERQLAYWKRTLGEAQPLLELPSDRARPLASSYRGGEHEVALDPDLLRRLQALAQRCRATLASVLLASYEVLLHRLSGASDVRVGITVANRNRAEIEGLVGFFVNALVIRGDLSGNPSFESFVEQLRRATLEAQEHQDLPFERLVEALAPQRSLNHHPLFQVSFNYQWSRRDELGEVGGLRVRPFERELSSTQFDLTLNATESASGLRASFTYARDLFEPETIARLAGHWVCLLSAIVADPSERVDRLAMYAPDEPARWHAALNQGFAPHAAGGTVQQRVAARALERPDAVAVRAGDVTLTYAELVGAARRLARELRAAGVGPDVVVGLCAERSLEMVVGLLGILEAGGAYLPLDPSYPDDRLRHMIEDGAVGLVLTQSALGSRLAGFGVACRELPSPLGASCASAMAGFEAAPLHPQSLAYCIYTSGSTGKPKGALLSHAALLAHMDWMIEEFGFDASARVLQKTPISFDASVWEFWLPLMTGGELVLGDPGVLHDPAALLAQIERDGVTVLQVVPQLLQLLLAEPSAPDSLGRLEHLFCGGEAVPLDLLRQVTRVRPAGLCNLYGPTETAIDAVFWRSRGELPARAVPIGMPIRHARASLLDGALGWVPPGVTGELYIGGATLARGYAGQPGLTAERFVPDPLSAEPGARMYRTGDLVRRRADGNLEFVGRRDHQVKVRGHRIELGEIEARLLEHEAVDSAVVLAQRGGGSDTRLLAYVVSNDAALRALGAAEDSRLTSEATEEWQAVFDRAYAVDATTTGPTFTGWNSSYTGAPIAQGEMQHWLEHTLSRLRALGAERVLEIGCGIGLLLEHLAPECREYVGSDFSAKALRDLRGWLGARSGFDHVELLQREALDFDGLGSRRFDAVVLNSVVQYFVDVDYLIGVLDGARAVLAPGGALFVGDVRSRPLLGFFHASVELAKAADGCHLGELRRRVERAMAHDKELVLDPGLFDAWARANGGRAEVLLKRGYADNELCRYRYDVALRFGSASAGWGGEPASGVSTIAELEARLASRPGRVLLKGLPNRRLSLDRALWRALENGDPRSSVAELRSMLAATARDGEEPEDYWALGEARGYRVQVRWSPDGAEGAFDVLLEDPRARAPAAHGDAERADAPVRPWASYANDPLLAKLKQGLGPRLRQHLERRVPDYMLPAQFAVLEQLPLTPNGKVDREALAAMDSIESSAPYAAPRTRREAELAEIWRDLLGVTRVGVRDNFFEIGGDSIIAIQVVSRARRAGITLRPSDIFQHQTLEALALHAEAAEGQAAPGDADAAAPALPPVTLSDAELESLGARREQIADAYPLSPVQQGMLFHSLYSPDSGVYVNQVRVTIDGLDVARFRAAWQGVYDRHDILRTGFLPERALQVVFAKVEIACREVDVRGRELGPDALRAFAREELAAPFDLRRPPLQKVLLLRLDERRYHLIWTHHHVLIDGWSSSRQIDEVLRLYTGQALPPVQARYKDYIAWLARKDWRASEAFWKKQLEGLGQPTLLCPDGHGEPQRENGHGVLGGGLDREQTARLVKFAKEQRVTLNTVVQAAWVLLLQRYTRQRTVAFGAAVSGRPAALPGVEALLGPFIHTLPVIAGPAPSQALGAFLRQLQENNSESREHDHTPLHEIQRWGAGNGQAFFDTLLAFQNYPIDRALREAARGEVTLSDVEGVGPTNFALTLQVTLEDRLEYALGYWRPHFDLARVEALSRHFEHLLLSLPAAGERPIGDLTLAPAAELGEQALWNQTQSAFPEELCIHELVEATSARAPDASAVIFGDERLSYGELQARANALARRLRRAGVGPDRLVGVCMERSVELVVALLAVLKAGGAYLPLDPDYPNERLHFMVTDGGVELLLTQGHLEQRLAGLPAERWCLDAPEAFGVSPEDAHNLPNLTHPDHLAYCIYTSGSTGQPKGCGNTHRGLHNRLRWMQDAYRLTPVDRVLQKTPFSFDVSVWEFFWPLITGAAIVMAPPGAQRDPAELARVIDAAEVTTLHFVPSMLQAFVAAGKLKGRASIRRILCSGEALPLPLARQVLEQHPAELFNLYGPTEAAIDVSHWPCRGGVDDGVPIGRPIANITLHVLDAALQPLPAGVTGELYIGGVGLARGYHRRPGLTAERFVPNPSSSEPGARLYRTGDLCRFRADGAIEYQGRVDHQVKVRGHRIELGEIEQRLSELELVRQAVALVRDDPSGERELVAFVVPELERFEPSRGSDGDRARTAEWGSVFDSAYAEAPESRAPSFVGWNDSYTGAPIPEAHMQRWLAAAVARMLESAPRRVLEIGCGVGLVAQHVAPRADVYVGTDVSRRAIENLRAWVSGQEGLAHIELLHRDASDWSGLDTRLFDLVVLNSVVQYFPNAEYLVRALEGALSVVQPGGRVFIGDVRSLDLARAFHASVQLARAPAELTLGELGRRIERALAQETELLVAPDLFRALGRSAGVHVSLELQRTPHDNELSRYRYDAIVTRARREAPEVPPREWRAERPLAELDGLLRSERPRSLSVSRVENRRLARDRALLRWLNELGDGATVADLRERFEAIEPRGLDPESFWALGDAHGYDVRVRWTPGDADGRFDVEFQERERPACFKPSAAPIELSAPDGGWRGLTNDPELARTRQRLTTSLREQLEQRLPSYMVPSRLMLIDAVPITANGKLDRKALLAASERESTRAYVRPRNETEQRLAQIWQEVLGVDQLGARDDFFELGGHSLLATRVASRVAHEFGVELPLRVLFERRQLGDLAAAIDRAAQQAREHGAVRRPPLVPQPRSGPLPLSAAQRRLWFLWQLEPNGSAYNMPCAVRLRGPLDAAALSGALDALVLRHESLRTRFVLTAGGEPRQVIDPPRSIPLAHARLEGSAVEREAALRRDLDAASRRPFDLERGPLVRAHLWRLDADEHVLLVTMHHVISDGWSLDVVMSEFTHLYASLARGAQPSLAALPVQYADYAVWQKAWLDGGEEARQLEYWRQKLRGECPILELPTARARPAQPSFRGHNHRFDLSPELVTRLRALGAQSQVTLFPLLLGAFAVVASQRSGLERFRIGTDSAGRSQLEIEGVVGFFVNQLVLELRVDRDAAAQQWLANLHADVLEALEHQDVPFDEVVKVLAPTRRLGQSPFFGIKVIYQERAQSLAGRGGLSDLGVEPVELSAQGAELDLVLGFIVDGNDVHVDMNYATDLFDLETLQGLEHSLRAVLEDLTEQPTAPVARLLDLSRQSDQHARAERALQSKNAAKEAAEKIQATLPIRRRNRHGGALN
ncbi:amino acid adenylation domain-containing protein [Sorangium sp. So ce861]|uniref:amino acid adenylation domain-containing protein n=1 Tax=Sorangium sp. So ce861 TaxID=3133323 RepID=UPI003F5DBA4D